MVQQYINVHINIENLFSVIVRFVCMYVRVRFVCVCVCVCVCVSVRELWYAVCRHGAKYIAKYLSKAQVL